MKPQIGTLLLAYVVFLLSIAGSSTINRPIKQEAGRETSPGSQGSSNRGHIRVVPKVEPTEEPYVRRIYGAHLHPQHTLRPVKQEPEESPRYRDPAHAHLDIDLNRLPPEAFANRQQRVYRPVARYPDNIRISKEYLN